MAKQTSTPTNVLDLTKNVWSAPDDDEQEYDDDDDLEQDNDDDDDASDPDVEDEHFDDDVNENDPTVPLKLDTKLGSGSFLDAGNNTKQSPESYLNQQTNVMQAPELLEPAPDLIMPHSQGTVSLPPISFFKPVTSPVTTSVEPVVQPENSSLPTNETDTDKGVYDEYKPEPLTDEELRTMAEADARTRLGMVNLLNTILAFGVQMGQLRKGDRDIHDAWQKKVQKAIESGKEEPTPKEGGSIEAAIKRVERYLDSIGEIGGNSGELDESSLNLLKRSRYFELKRQASMGEAGERSFMQVTLSVMGQTFVQNLNEVLLIVFDKMSQRAMKL